MARTWTPLPSLPAVETERRLRQGADVRFGCVERAVGPLFALRLESRGRGVRARPAHLRPSSDAPTMSAPCGKRIEDLFGRRLPIRSSRSLELNGRAKLKSEDDQAHHGCPHVDDQEAETAHVAERSNPSTTTTSYCRDPVGEHGVTCLCETQPNGEGRARCCPRTRRQVHPE